MWTVIHIAPNPSLAYKIKSALENEGIMVSLRQESGGTEILVSELEAEEAHEIIVEKIMLPKKKRP